MYSSSNINTCTHISILKYFVQDYSSSETDSSDAGDDRKLPATTKASLNQAKSSFAPVLYEADVDHKDDNIDGMLSMDISKLKVYVV